MNELSGVIGVTQRAANPESRKVASYPAFDVLRITLASIVVLGHEGASLPGPLDGSLAVSVFFALSGWLIGGILLETQPSELPRFFFNRATRIWIPYAAAIVLLYGFAAVYEGAGLFWAKYLFYDATFTHQVFTHFPQAASEMPLHTSGNQFWSISVEEQFYLAAPVIMLLPFGRRLLPWVVIAALFIAGSILGAPIALGVIAAILRRDYGDWHQAPGVRPLLIAATLGSLCTLFVSDTAALRALFSIGVVLCLAVPGKRQPLSVFLGGISYPVYLNHWVGAWVGHGVTRHLLHFETPALFVAIAFSTALVSGAAAYWLIDRQVMARRNGWFEHSKGVACGATAYTLVISGLIGGWLLFR